MTLTGLLIFAGAYLLATATPGPGVTALLARVLARGMKDVWVFIAGFIVGDLILFAIAAAGLAALAQSYQPLFFAVKYCGVAYLLYLAYKLWTAPVDAAQMKRSDRDESGMRLFLTSLSLTVGNPKPIIFFMALLPTLMDMRGLTLFGALEISVLIVVILGAVLTAYALLAERGRRFVTSPKRVQVVNRACGTALGCAAIAIAKQ